MALAGGLLAACGTSTSSSGTKAGSPQRGGVLTMGVPLAALKIDPALSQGDQASEQLQENVFATLVQFVPGSKNPAPSLATSWAASNNQQTFTFHLRKAFFSNGAPITSADVKYSLGVISAPTYFLYAVYGIIKNVETPNASTVVINLKEPTPNFVWYLDTPLSSITDAAAIAKMGDKAYNLNPVASGAFEIKKWIQGQEIDLVPNPHYWVKNQPYVSEVRLKYIPDDNARLLALKSGGINIADAINYSDVATLRNAAGINVATTPSADFVGVVLNEKYKPLSDELVRQALVAATPAAQILKVAFSGLGQVMNVDIQKLVGWDSAVKRPPYDIAAAKRLLAKSTYPKGFTINVLMDTGDQAVTTTLEILQASWAQIGVKLNIVTLDYGTEVNDIVTFKYQATVLPPNGTSSDLPVMDEFAIQNWDDINGDRHNNFSYFYDPADAKLAFDAVHSTDPATQAKLFDQLQVATMANPEEVAILWPDIASATSSNVHGFQDISLGWWNLWNVWISH